MWLLLGILTVTLLFLFLRRRMNFWKDQGIATPKNLYSMMWKLLIRELSPTDAWRRIYDDFKSQGLRHGGMIFFSMPSYVPVDSEIVKKIMQADFNHFVDRGLYFNEKSEPLSAHLFALEGQKWKVLRQKLTPTFTSGKMKMMFETLVNCTKGLCEAIDIKSGKELDVKDILGRFTTDIIGSCAFGLECNTLKNPESEFRSKGVEALKLSGLRNFMVFAAPELMRTLNIKFFAPGVCDFFMGVVKDTVEYREKNQIHRKDFMHLLIQLKNGNSSAEDENSLDKTSKDTGNGLTIEEIAAQALVFYLAGYETSSSAMTFGLYEVAGNKDIQDRIRKEIKDVLKEYDGKLTYEAVSKMHYLEQAINETLRKHPTLPALFRRCTEDYHVEGTDLVIKKGMRVNIPIVGIHYDPEYYPDPEKFDPDRFSEENIRRRPAFTFLPFGEGPRVCIGLRFGMLQAKVGLIALLLNYEFTVNKRTIEPIEYDGESLLAAAKGGIWLDAKKISTETIDICVPRS